MGQNDNTHTEEHTAAASAACSDESIDESACDIMESDEQGQHTEEVRVKAPSASTRIKQNAKHKTGFQAEWLQT